MIRNAARVVLMLLIGVLAASCGPGTASPPDGAPASEQAAPAAPKGVESGQDRPGQPGNGVEPGPQGNERPVGESAVAAIAEAVAATIESGGAKPETRDPSVEVVVDAHLARMTLEQKVGQVFMVGFQGTEPGPDSLSLIQERYVGGLTLFRRNTPEAGQAAHLIEGLQEAASANGAGIPLFISIDQEGGTVARIVRGVTVFPGNMALGASGDPELARLAAEATNRELAALGVNMNLGPVVDVNNNPRNPVIGTRAFGSSPEMVASLGQAAIAGIQAGGVAAVAKHFPGHGDTHVDSHYGLPVLDLTAGRLAEIELVPFRAAIDAGVDGIMTAHVHLPALEPGDHVPATLSHVILTQLLREELGYDGLILTDALDMAAIKGRGSVADAAVLAFEAGADMLLIAGIEPSDLSARQGSFDAMLEAVHSGRVSQERLEESVRRVLRAKVARGLLPLQPEPPAAGEGTGQGEGQGEGAGLDAQAVAQAVAERAITVVRDDAGLLPLREAPAGGVLTISTRAPTASLVVDRDVDARLAAALGRHVHGVEEIILPARPSAGEIQGAARRAAGKGLVVLGTYDAWRSRDQQALVQAVLGSGAPTVVVGLRTPYDLLALPEIPTYVAVYSDRPVALEALAAFLFGHAPAQGRLPVDLPGLYPLGHGLLVP